MTSTKKQSLIKMVKGDRIELWKEKQYPNKYQIKRKKRWMKESKKKAENNYIQKRSQTNKSLMEWPLIKKTLI